MDSVTVRNVQVYKKILKCIYPENGVGEQRKVARINDTTCIK